MINAVEDFDPMIYRLEGDTNGTDRLPNRVRYCTI